MEQREPVGHLASVALQEAQELPEQLDYPVLQEHLVTAALQEAQELPEAVVRVEMEHLAVQEHQAQAVMELMALPDLQDQADLRAVTAQAITRILRSLRQFLWGPKVFLSSTSGNFLVDWPVAISKR